MVDLPDYLQEGPTLSPELRPPVRGRPQLLPFDEITWERFEQLSLRLFSQERELVDFRLYGTPGQNQEGIDFYGVAPAGAQATAQCRRVRTIRPAEIRALVADFLEGPWAEASESLTLFTAASARPTGVAAEIERQREGLAGRDITFMVRDAERLSGDLKNEPDLVDDFFGPDWRRAFCPGEELAARAVEMTDVAREVAELSLAAARRPRLLDIDSLNVAVQRAVRTLTEHDEDEFALLEPVLADPRPAARAAKWIVGPPPAIAEASWQFWAALTRIAERGGEWGAAADGWLHIAEVRDGEGSLRAIVNASIAAGIAGDEDRAAELFGRARQTDPDHPKVRLQEVEQLEKPADQIAALEGLVSDDEDEQALIELNRALAYVQINAFEDAEHALRRAEVSAAERLPQLALVRSNLTVQRNRINASRGRPLDGRALEQAERDCLAARETLISEHRFEESVRALMLAVDAVAMRTDFAGAEALLAMATEDEVEARDGSAVLGDSALRCMIPRLALRFTERSPNTDERRRIRAAALLALRQDVGAARRELRNLALGDGSQSRMAAFFFCRDGAFHHGDWDADVAEVLARESPVEAITLEAWHLARSARHSEAQVLLRRHEHEHEHWALQLRFALATLADDPEALALVRLVLASNPDRHTRLRCAGVLFTHPDGDRERAEAEARQVAEDQAAPMAERSEGYHLLVNVLAAARRWLDVQRELRGWALIDPGDDRLNAWQVRVGNRLSRRD